MPPELVFNQSLGALFVVRTAGNVADDFGLASIEYAIVAGLDEADRRAGARGLRRRRGVAGHADPGDARPDQLVQRIRTSFVGIPYRPNDPAVVLKSDGSERARIGGLARWRTAASCATPSSPETRR